MHVIDKVDKMQIMALAARCDVRRIGLVPTMGFLHEGHLSLMRKARSLCDLLVVSIFVNPTQFAIGEDLDNYPRDIERDIALCESEQADVVFCPTVSEMYAEHSTVYIDERELSKGLCGGSRPGHFSGVLTVVAKLFNIIQPDVAVFGQKDAQQARVIQQMVVDLNFPVKILIEPTVRESDGLAMSSRNTYLSPDERARAVCLSKSLSLAEDLFQSGERNSESIIMQMNMLIEEHGGNVDYVDIVDYVTLRPVARISCKALVLLAVKFGDTRLIDNVIIDV